MNKKGTFEFSWFFSLKNFLKFETNVAWSHGLMYRLLEMRKEKYK